MTPKIRIMAGIVFSSCCLIIAATALSDANYLLGIGAGVFGAFRAWFVIQDIRWLNEPDEE